jgi:dTDP-glucose 4,6-dehydratase/UDP-glucose 4-epimerase
MNLGSSEVVGLRRLAQQLVAVHGGGQWELVPFPPERKAIDIGDYYGDWARARQLLGWAPKVGLEEGLKRTLAYYRVHGAASYWE